MSDSDLIPAGDPRARIEEISGRIAKPAPAGSRDPEDAELPDPEPDEYDDDIDEDLEPSAPDLVFTTKKKERDDQDADARKVTHFDIDGEIYSAVKPAEAAYVFLTTAAARSMPMSERMAAIIQFLDHALTEESGIRVRDRLLDRDDEFSFEDLLDILQKIVKHWTRGKGGKGPQQARYRGRRPGRRR